MEMHVVLSEDLWGMRAEAGKCPGQGFDRFDTAAEQEQEAESGVLMEYVPRPKITA